MCQFFSFCGDGHGNYLYADWKERKALKFQECDSHSSILTRSGIPAEKQDRYSMYEYNPLTKYFNVDRGVDKHDHEAARNWVEARDWKYIVKHLIVKPIIHPFTIKHPKITETDKKLLRKWASVRASVWDSVRDSVWASVGASVRASVWNSVGDSVWNSVRASVWDSVGNSVWDSVWASVWGYISSFFSIKYKYDYSPCIRLWESGLVPSFDGKTWRLHGGKDAKVMYEWTPRVKKCPSK